MATLMLPVLIGFVGLAIDVGYTFDYRKQMQTAADSAALAGAYAVHASVSISQTNLESVIRADAGANTFAHGINSISVTVCRPTAAGCAATYSYTANDGAVV